MCVQHGMTGDAVLVVLRPMIGFKTNKEQLERYVDGAWQAAYASLWNGMVFSDVEVAETKGLIRAWLLQYADVEAAYKELVQRVLMTRLYLQKHGGKYVPIPSVWFCTTNANGFAGTAKWYAAMLAQRRAMPLHRIVLQGFAEGVLEMQQVPSGKVFHYWRGYFSERGEQQLLNLFLCVVAWGRLEG